MKYLLKISKFYKLILPCIFFLLNSSSLYAVPATLQWESIDAGNGEALYSDSGYTSKLAEGCLLQLILDVDGDGLDSIEHTGSTSPAGDDILIPLTSGSNTGSIGANMPFDKPGHFQYIVGFNGSSYGGKTVYVRYWNSASPGSGSAYGESIGFTLQDVLPVQIFNIVASGSLYTNTTLHGTTTTVTGRVYDSDTNVNISSPLIKLYSSAGSLISSTTQNPYTFTVSKSASYYLRVDKQGYIFPSNNVSAQKTGDHGEIFSIGTSKVTINIPMDSGNVLTISYAINKKQAVVGDIVTFNVNIKNNSTLAQENITLEATKMKALKYVSDTAYLDTSSVSVTDTGSKYKFSITSISGSGASDLSYQAIVSPGASVGQYKSIAVCYKLSSYYQASNSDEVKIFIKEDALMQRGTIIGKVFLDPDANGVQDRQPPTANREPLTANREKGLGGVKIITEYGIMVTTDENGKYHIPDVPVGRHIIKVMEKSLPEENMIILENPRWITTTEGILNKVNFSVMKRQKPEEAEEKLPEETKERKFTREEIEKEKIDKRERIIEKKVVEEGPTGKHIREEKYELIEREIEEVGPDGKIIKKRIKGYVKTEFVGEIEVVEVEEPKLEPLPEVVLVKGEEPVPEPEEKVKVLKIFKDTFLVALAEGTARKNINKGDEGFLTEKERFLREGWRWDGRLAFTLLTKLFNKFNLTASLDTDRIRTAARKYITQQKFMTNPHQDDYYPVYGDGSEIDYSATDTQDIVYAKATWDKSEAVWGSYKVDLPLYQKTHHGGKVEYNSVGKTKFDRPWTELDAFYAVARQKSAHDEFIGTGGSLYYLRHSDIIEGSEMLKVLVKDRLTNRTMATIPLKEQVDYEIDYLQGRVLLKQILNTVSQFYKKSIISNDILSGEKMILSADYVYHTDDFHRNAYGGRVSQNITDHLTMEGTYIEEEKADSPYKLYGGKATLQLNEDSFVSARYSRSEETQLASGLSFDGGFNFTLNTETWSNDHKGDELDINAHTVLFNKIDLSAGYANTDEYFNATDSLERSGLESYYAEAVTSITKTLKAGVKHYTQKLGADTLRALTSGNTGVSVTKAMVDYNKDKLDIMCELQHQEVDTPLASYTYTGTIPLRDNDFVAAQLGYKVNEIFRPYIRGQGTISGRANNQVTLGTELKIKDNIYLQLAETVGNMGNSTKFGLNKILLDSSTLYTNIELGRHLDLGKYIKTTSGQSAPISDTARIYMEEDYSSYQERFIRGRVLGFVQELANNWQLAANYNRSHYNDRDELVNRDSGSIAVSYLNIEKLKLFSKLELREDRKTGAKIRQWVTENLAHWYINQDLSVLGRVNISTTTDEVADDLKAGFNEIGIGAAYRPIDYDRLNILAKYSYITDKPPVERTAPELLTNLRKHVASVEGSFDINRYLELTGKCAYRSTEEKVGVHDWLSSDTMLYIGRVNVHVTKKWNIAGEYRVLKNDKLDAEKDGFLIEIQRSIYDNFQIGGGYNFTDFSDDLTHTDDYRNKGWFIRVTGKY